MLNSAVVFYTETVGEISKSYIVVPSKDELIVKYEAEVDYLYLELIDAKEQIAKLNAIVNSLK